MSLPEDPWSPTGWVARLRRTDEHGSTHETEENVQAWGPGGEPLIGGHRDAQGRYTDVGKLVDASTLPHFVALDSALYRGNPFAAAPGWSVRITHPNGATEVRAVGAWMPIVDGSAAPMVPGKGEYEGHLVYVGQEYDEPTYKFGTTLIPPQ